MTADAVTHRVDTVDGPELDGGADAAETQHEPGGLTGPAVNCPRSSRAAAVGAAGRVPVRALLRRVLRAWTRPGRPPRRRQGRSAGSRHAQGPRPRPAPPHAGRHRRPQNAGSSARTAIERGRGVRAISPRRGAALGSADTFGRCPPPTPTISSVCAAHGRTTSRTSASICPKRRLTVFTGVSGSGKSSLVFATIAAESQRLINETYSAFVQGFMPTPRPPGRRRARGPDHGDHRRPGADGRQRPLDRRHGDRRQRDAADPVQPAGQPHVGSPQAFSFNIPSVKGAGAVTFERGGGKPSRSARSFSITGGMCPRCEGMGSVTDIDLDELYDESKSLSEGAITVPGYTADGWCDAHLQGGGLSTRTSRSATTPTRSATTSSARSRPRSRSRASTSPTRAWSRRSRSRCSRRTARRCSRTSAPSSTGR